MVIFSLQINLLKKCCVTFVRSTYQLHNLMVKANQVFYKNKSTCIWFQICYTVHIINVAKSMCAPTQYWQCHLHFYQTRGNLLTALKIKKRTHCTVPVTFDILVFVEHITITYSFFGSWHFSLCDLNVLNGTFTPQNMHVTSG